MKYLVAVLVALVMAAVWRLNSQTSVDVTATLSWTPPTQNTDGSPLVDLASHKVYRSVGPSGQRALIATVPAADGGAYVDNDLANGQWCYVVTAVRANGAESAVSSQACKTIDARVARAPTGLTVE